MPPNKNLLSVVEIVREIGLKEVAIKIILTVMGRN